MKPKIKDQDFYEAVNKAIAENRHVEYLKGALEDYKAYKKKFEECFTEDNPVDGIYKFRASYFSKKPIWREVEILGRQKFLNLAETIIKSMKWANDHMHGFELPSKNEKANSLSGRMTYEFFSPGMEDDPYPTFKTSEIRICDLNYHKVPKLKFVFDFGDGHMFDIEYLGLALPDKKVVKGDFPRLVDQRGVAPEQYPD